MTKARDLANITSSGSILADGVISLSEVTSGTNNGVVYFSGAGVASSGSALTFDGTTFATTGNVTLGDASTDTVQVNGYMGVGGAANANRAVYLAGTNTGTGTSQNGVLVNQSCSSSATSNFAAVEATSITPNTAFTLTSAYGFRATDASKGAASTITNLYGVYVNDQTQGTNNYGITSTVSSGTNKWNIYASGTANNYFAGNVGAGTNVPSNPLHIYAASAPQMRIQDGVGSFYIGRDGTGNALLNMNQSYAMIFNTAATERMRIDSAGNVGIGVTSMAYPLDVKLANNQFILAREASTNITNGFRIGGVNNEAKAVFSANSATGEVNLGAISTNYFLTFSTNGANERMRIDTSGNLLVGTTTTLGTTANGSIQVKGGGGGPYVITCRNRDVSGGANQIEFQDGSGDVCGAINSNATSNTTAYVTSSDYRLKENIAPMSGALTTLAKLNPVTWNWKHAPEVVGQGFIAHELQEVVPDAVTGKKDAVDAEGKPQYQGVDTSFLVATLTAAIQEQQAIIESLKARLDAANL